MIVLNFILVFLLVTLFCLIVMIAKNEVTFINLCVIAKAIYLYNCKKIDEEKHNEIIDFEVIKDYDAVLNNIFDWGIKNIVPPAEFEKIKPYIKDAADMIKKR